MRILLALLFLMPLAVIAQATGSIRGHIRDQETGEDIPFGIVYLMPQDTSDQRIIVGAYSDEYGNYELRSVSPGTYTLCFRLVGMKALDVTEIVVESGKVLFRNADMEPEPYEVW